MLSFPILVQGANTLYEEKIRQACNGNYAVFLHYLQNYHKQNELSTEQVADWLQVSSWAGNGEKVIQIWQQYQNNINLPARGIAAVAQSWRNKKEWLPAHSLWKKLVTLHLKMMITALAILKRWLMPVWINESPRII